MLTFQLQNDVYQEKNVISSKLICVKAILNELLKGYLFINGEWGESQFVLSFRNTEALDQFL